MRLLRCSPPARILPCFLLLTDPRSSPQVLPARPSPVVDPMFSPRSQPVTVLKKCATSLTSARVPVEEPVSDGEQFSDHASSHMDEESEVSDMESSGPDSEELLDVDQELSAEQTYRDTILGVRSFMVWTQILEFDSASSKDDNPLCRIQNCIYRESVRQGSHRCLVVQKV